SINDTIVVFDRIRENMRGRERQELRTVIDQAVNETLSRTVVTGGTTFLTVLVFFLLGGKVMEGFGFGMIVGLITGTYSSVFIAAPLLMLRGEKLAAEIEAEHFEKLRREREELKQRARGGVDGEGAEADADADTATSPA
ncbi:MAG: hypothetical protein HY719_15320, partial [Planctomycetes bacterium]|nr:hypothetical protein [Planctomycetota bacterium]